MDQQPSIELLEAHHQFPCSFTFKVIGRNDEAFTGRVLAAVREHLGEEVEPAFSVRKSGNGNHISVTLEPEVPTASSVVEIYSLLREVEGVVMLF